MTPHTRPRPNTRRPVLRRLWLAFQVAASATMLVLAAGVARAEAHTLAMERFGAHCFSPFLTAEAAERHFGEDGLRHDFYDLRPLRAANAISPAVRRAATPGTDRRCEVAVDGAHTDLAIARIAEALQAEGIVTDAPVPQDFPAHPDAIFVAARQLNPNRVAVVQVGTRSGPNGPETFLNVERLEPLNEAGQ